jgi:hypothetical protein
METPVPVVLALGKSATIVSRATARFALDEVHPVVAIAAEGFVI